MLNGTTADRAPGLAETTAGEAATRRDELMVKVATVGVIGIGAALFEAALIPGMVLGVAAMLLPTAMPKLAAGAQPVVRSVVRGAYHAGRRARHAVAEAQEQVQDIVAEANAETAAPSAG